MTRGRAIGCGCLGLVLGLVAASPFAVATGAVGAWLLRTPPDPDAAPVARVVPPPEEPGPVAFTGVVLPIDTVDVTVSVEAKLVAVPVALGDPVVRGQVVARLDAAALADRIAGSRAAADASAAGVRQAEIALGRASQEHTELELARSAVPASQITAADYAEQQARSALSEARARRTQAKAALAELEGAMAGGDLVAPIDGVVAATLVPVGSTLRPGDAVVRIASDELGVRFAVDPAALGAVTVGDPVGIEVPVVGATLSGRVLRVSPWVDSASGLVLAEASLEGTDDEGARRVVAGMTARVIEREDGGG